MELPYERIEEVRASDSPAATNELLSSGWVLVKAVEKLGVDSKGNATTSIVYIVGRKRGPSKTPRARCDNGSTKSCSAQSKSSNLEQPRAATDKQEVRVQAPSEVPGVLSLEIDWHQKKDMNPNFYYAFAYGQGGDLDPVVSRVVNAIDLSSSRCLEQNGWKFTVSKDGRFLQRSKIPTVREAAVK